MSFFGQASFVLRLVLWTQLYYCTLIRNSQNTLKKIEICSKNGKMTSSNSSSHKKFLIDNILRPEFGKKQKSVNNCTEEKIAKENPKKIETETSLPSWIYCTRYSDRPSSSGKFLHSIGYFRFLSHLSLIGGNFVEKTNSKWICLHWITSNVKPNACEHRHPPFYVSVSPVDSPERSQERPCLY